jgi:alpha-amylase
MVDVVANNYAYAGPGQDTVYSDFVPFNKEEYFHPFCYISNYSDTANAQDVRTFLKMVRLFANCGTVLVR